MKKLFIVLAVASLGFVACNNDGEKKPAEDTTVAPVTPAPDTTTPPAQVDTTGAAKADTTTKPAAH